MRLCACTSSTSSSSLPSIIIIYATVIASPVVLSIFPLHFDFAHCGAASCHCQAMGTRISVITGGGRPRAWCSFMLVSSLQSSFFFLPLFIAMIALCIISLPFLHWVSICICSRLLCTGTYWRVSCPCTLSLSHHPISYRSISSSTCLVGIASITRTDISLTELIYYLYHPCCTYTHAAIDTSSAHPRISTSIEFVRVQHIVLSRPSLLLPRMHTQHCGAY